MSIGGSSSKSSSQQQSNSQATSQAVSGSTSSQSIAFSDLFQNLFGGASNAAAKAVGGGQLQGAANQLFTGGMDFFKNLGGDAGTSYLNSRITGENPILDEQISQLGEDTGRFFREQINPAITSRAVSGGNLGGGRQGVAQALGADAATRQYTQGVTQLRLGDQQARDSAALEVARNSLSAASTGLGALPTLLQANVNAASPELGVFQQLAGILGGPTTLTSSDSFSRSISEAFSNAFGSSKSSSFGFSLGV